jgi:2-polyprenyl-6-methoxyphenol hydroxylase-like FAD-dependent oxidoreductase
MDILVCGGGYVGLSAAVALKLAAPSLDDRRDRRRTARGLAQGPARLG